MLTQSKLQSQLAYNPFTGVFTRLVTNSPRVRVGDVAGSLGNEGYLTIMVLGKMYKAHRLAWFYIYGEWPLEELDHENRDRSDNRIYNLRAATKAQNQQNRNDDKLDAIVSFMGVDRCKKFGNYRARIALNGKTRFLGRFPTAEIAAAAYASAKKALHPFAHTFAQ